MPRYATARNPSRKTRGPELAAIAARLGTPLMEWQRLIADVGLEVLDDGITPAYREIVVTVPRQSGKTALVLAWELHRALAWGSPQAIAYTAQTGFDARRKLMDDQVPALQNSTLAPSIKRIYTANGNESIIFRNGSRIQVLPSTPTAGHGKTISLAVIDEAFADYEGIREAALLPAMATKRDGQILIVSTAGTSESMFLRRKVDAGRQAIKDGLINGVAYFEWSADPDDDPFDPITWAKCMPALFHTIDTSTIDHALATMTLTDFRRSYLNTWTNQDDRLIPEKSLVFVQLGESSSGGTSLVRARRFFRSFLRVYCRRRRARPNRSNRLATRRSLDLSKMPRALATMESADRRRRLFTGGSSGRTAPEFASERRQISNARRRLRL